MSLDRSRDVMFPLVILVAVAVGAVIGGTLVRGTASTPAPVDPSASSTKELADAIDALRKDLLHARGTSAGLVAPSTDSNRVDASGLPSDASKDLVAEMRKVTAELTQAVNALRNSAQRSGGDRAPLVAPARAPDPRLLDDVAARNNAERNKVYQLWTYQQVLDRFGAPDAVYNDERDFRWHYKHGNDKYVNFMFVDGRVFDVQTDD